MPPTTEARARLSAGTSTDPVYAAVADCLATRHPGGGVLVDYGCGRGDLFPFLAGRFDQYHGVDLVRYDGLPDGVEFHRVDLDTGRGPLPNGFADVVTAVETIEHLENPRALARELTRVCRPGGTVVVTTPNQLSVLGKLGLCLRNEFPAFRGGNYPAHLTALLAVDLRRISGECGWAEVAVSYSRRGRMPGTARHWPGWVSRAWPRAFSDNVVVAGRAPEAGWT